MNRRDFLKVLGVTGAAITAAPVISQTKTKENDDGALIFETKGGEKYAIDTSGRMGIGVTPSKWNTKL